MALGHASKLRCNTDNPRYPPNYTRSYRKEELLDYFNFVPTAVYGTTGSGPFCTFRDICLPCCQSYPQAFKWMLIAAERHTALLRRLPAAPSLFRRKAEAYKAIGRLLQDESTRYTDEALVMIIEAVVIESRFLDVEVTRMHIRGLVILIQQRGGLPSLFQSPADMYHPLFLLGSLTSVPLDQSSREEVDRCRTGFLQSFAEIDKWNQSLRTLVASKAPADRDKELRIYLENRRRAFTSPVMEQCISSPLTMVKETYCAQTSRFVALSLLNIILYRYNKSDHKPRPKHGDPRLFPNPNVFIPATSFLHTLLYSLHYSGTINPLTNTSSIRLETLVWIIVKAWVDADPIRASSALGKEEELFLTEMTMPAIRLWGRMRDSQRDAVTAVLKAWLIEGFE